MAKWRVAGISFDHMHMGDLLRQVTGHGNAEIVGIYDPSREKMASAIETFGIPADRVFTDLDACLTASKPDLAIVCSATAAHADHVERVAKHKVHVLVEKPFAASVAEADRMTAAMREAGRLLAINWPLAWYPSHNTTKRLIDDGMIGDLIEVHYYDGNRGPLYHLADKVEVTDADGNTVSKFGAASYKSASADRFLAPGVYKVRVGIKVRTAGAPVPNVSVSLRGFNLSDPIGVRGGASDSAGDYDNVEEFGDYNPFSMDGDIIF